MPNDGYRLFVDPFQLLVGSAIIPRPVVVLLLGWQLGLAP